MSLGGREGGIRERENTKLERVLEKSVHLYNIITRERK